MHTRLWSETLTTISNRPPLAVRRRPAVGPHLAAHQRLPQVRVPLLQARARSAPLAVHAAQSVPQLRRPLRSQVDGEHGGLVASEHLVHLLREREINGEAEQGRRPAVPRPAPQLTLSSLALAVMPSTLTTGSTLWWLSSAGVTISNQEVMSSRSDVSCCGSEEPTFFCSPLD